MFPPRRDDREDDENEEPDFSGPPIPETLPQSVKDVWARKRRRIQSVKDANTMWQPILENYREYSKTLTFVPWRET